MESFGDYPLIGRWSIFTPKGFTTHTKAPQSILKAILYQFFDVMEI